MIPGTKIKIKYGQFEGYEGIIQDSEVETWTGVRRNKRGKVMSKFDHKDKKVWVWVIGENLRVLIGRDKV